VKQALAGVRVPLTVAVMGCVVNGPGEARQADIGLAGGGLAAGGADVVRVETQFDLAEARAAVIAVRETCDLPVAVSMTFDKGACLTGTAPLTFIDTMQNMGVELLGTNCSAGPEQLVDVVRAMLPRLSTPLVVQPNAGLPELDGQGRTVFRLGPEEFAAQVMGFVDMGAKFLGGCCGTRRSTSAPWARAWASGPGLPEPPEPPCLVVTSRFAPCPGPRRPAVIIGERINPTGKKELTAQRQEGRFDAALRLAEEQVRDGAGILDVNVGAPLVEEAALLPALVQGLSSRVQAPRGIDSTDIGAGRAALDAYPASPLVNSISGEPGRMEELGPLCRLYGAPFILLPLKGRKLPVSAAERLDVVEELLCAGRGPGHPRRLIVVDALVLRCRPSRSRPWPASRSSAVPRALGAGTTCGLSNISSACPRASCSIVLLLPWAWPTG
jgi:5-methyltetrahydrofolate--homocysteine methyltransferase